MSRRWLQIVATFNVVSACVLYLWWQSIGGVSANAEQAVDQVSHLNADARLEWMSRFRDAWRTQAGQYRALAAGALVVIALNAVFSFLHLLRIDTASEARRSDETASPGPEA